MSEVEPGKAKAAGIVGILVGITALINLICGFIYVGLVGGADASGIWSGIGQLIIAILGIVTWVKLNKMAFVFYLVFCILWLIICIVQVIVALIAWLIWWVIKKVVETNCKQVGDHCVCNADKALPTTVSDCGDIAVVESCIIAIVITSAIAVILLFAGSIIGCMGVCCAKPQTNVVVVQQPGVVMTTTTTSHQQEAPPEYPTKY